MTTQYGFAPSDSWQTNPLFIKTDKGYAYYHNDQLGTPRLATDKNGNVVWQADYATNGEATLSSNNQITSNLRFPGQYFDSESNLNYNTRRYYDPSIGRYITQDPIGYSGGLNLYRYANGDPINQMDPTGEVVPLVGIGVGLRIVATEAAIMYGRCVTNCLATQTISNAIGICDDSNCFKECLNPLNWVRKTPRAPRSGVRNVAPPATPTTTPRSNYVDLTSPQRRIHILDGDATGGGHGAGRGISNKSEFPSSWSDDKVIHEISDIATDPNANRRPARGNRGRTIAEGNRDGIDIRVIQESNGDIVTGFPTNVPRNP